MEFKGTKGKWEKVHTKIQVEPENPMRTLTICQVFGGDEESLANAKLIAAAPELLEAFYKSIGVLNEILHDLENEQNHELAGKLERVIYNGNNIIKKALGGE